MLKRKVTDQLKQWKAHSKKAILVTGARQIGKSFAIRAFGTEEYASYFEVNLAIDKEARAALITAQNAQDFINRIVLLSPHPLIDGNALIFIDEVQECPEIVTMIKGLSEDGRFSFAFSGSMLGNNLKGITSFPVGYVEQIVMRPLDFEEFSWAVGVDAEFLDQVRECLAARKPVEEFLHEAMLKNYRAYMVAGGMPEVVQAYVDGGFSLIETRSLQTSLVKQYAQDIGKYAETRALEVRSIYDRIPVELEEDPRRFVISSLGKGKRFANYDQDFLWLVNAGVGLKVSQCTEAKSPLRRTEKASLFKLYQSDTGMLMSRYPQSMARAVYLDRRDMNLGGVFENVVAQELTALRIEAHFFQSEGIGEIDFLIEGRHGHVVPIEVKSGRKVRSHAALNKLLDVAEYKIPEGIVLSQNNLSREGKVLYAPIYMTFCLDELTEDLTEDTSKDFTFAPVSLTLKS